MKYILILLSAIVFISCSGNKTSDATTQSTSDVTPKEMTDQEKALIAEQVLEFSSKEMEDLKSDDCGTITKSLHLLYARQTIADKYKLNSDDINNLIGILESKQKALKCGGNSGDGPDITLDFKTEGGQSAYHIKIPTDAAIWAVLTAEQRDVVLASVPLYTRNQLLEMEAKYLPDINKIREVPTVIKVRPKAFVDPGIQTPTVIVNDKIENKAPVLMEKNKIDQTKFKKAEVVK
jgi:hypothetical protein